MSESEIKKPKPTETKGKITRAYYDFVCAKCGKEESRYLSIYRVGGKHPRTGFMFVRDDDITGLNCYTCLESAYQTSMGRKGSE